MSGFGPKNRDEERVFAIHRVRVEVQYLIFKTMKAKGVSQTELARRLGVKPPVVTRFFKDETNLRLSTVARIFDALGMKIEIDVNED